MNKMENDIQQLKIDVEKLTRHMSKNEKMTEDNNIILLNVQTALIGSEYNDKKGIVYVLNDIDKRVKLIEQKQAEHDIYVNQGKWSLGVVASVLIAFGVYVLKKINGL